MLDALVGTASYSADTPIKLALVTANGNDATAGTEVSGGSYARQDITFSAASSGSISNDAVETFTNMPTCTVVGIELWDSAGTPSRLAYGSLTASKALTSGDTLEFAIGSITLSLS
jgi:hypothetical protein